VGHRWVNELAVVMEYGYIDLLELMRKRKSPFERRHVKSFLYQALSAIHYLHQKHFLHRDIKLSNFILNKDGDLKLADFGLARSRDESEDPKYTSTVATLWYRAPELLLGETCYDGSVDIWATGCMFAETLRSKELFNGRSDLDQIHCIFNLLGTPTEDCWPGFSKLPVCGIIEFQTLPPKTWQDLFPDSPDSELDLLSQCLIYDPRKRITAADALKHPYFTLLPLPSKYVEDDEIILDG